MSMGFIWVGGGGGGGLSAVAGIYISLFLELSHAAAVTLSRLLKKTWSLKKFLKWQ
jgi:hypothetical protein